MLVFNAALVLVKISVTLMYRRIFVTRVMRIVTTTTLVFLFAWGPASIFSLAFICVPAEKFWDLSAEGQSHCKPMLPIFLACSVTNMITDFFIFLVPLPSIWNLQLPLKQKIVLGFALCLGFLYVVTESPLSYPICLSKLTHHYSPNSTCIISIVRLQALPAAAKTPDSSWDNVAAALWSIVEVTVAIIAACLPTLGPLGSRYFPRFMDLSSRGNGGAYINADSKNSKGGGGSALRSRNLGDGGSTTAELASRRNKEKNVGPDDSTEELYMTNHHNGHTRGHGNSLNDPEIGLSDLKFHAVTSTRPVNPEDSDSINSDQLPINGPVSTNIYGGNDSRITVPPSTVTKVAASHGKLKKSGGIGGGNGVIMATTVIKQEWKEQ